MREVTYKFGHCTCGNYSNIGMSGDHLCPVISSCNKSQTTARNGKVYRVARSFASITAVMICASAVLPTASRAQAGGQGTPSEGPVSAKPEVQEIIVTAQRRLQRIQDVPLSVTALGSAEVERAGINNVLELTASVPGLRMTNMSGNTAPAIRGITQLAGGAPGIDPSVATYVDGVYQAGEFALKLDLPDIARIEVDKGPQGTLFGRNATGGAIQIFTRDPEFTTKGIFSAGFGRYNDEIVKGFFTTPLVPDLLAISLSAFQQSSSSYSHSIVPGIRTRGVRATLERGKILFTPATGIRLLLEGYYGKHKDAYPEYQTPFNGISVARNIPGSVIPTKPRDVAGNRELFNNLTQYGGSLHGSFETGIGAITVLGSYGHSEAPSLTNSTDAFIPAPGTGIFIDAFYPQTTKTAEIDFASRDFGGFSFVAGLYYFHDSASLPLTVIENLGPNHFNYAFSLFPRQTSTAGAIFGEATYRVTPEFTVIAGVRYSKERREVFGGALLSFDPTRPYTVAPGPLPKYGQQEPDGVNERVSLKYNFAPRTNAYFTFSTGFRSGVFDSVGLPTSFTGTFIQPQDCTAANGCSFPVYVKPEKVKAYEVGLKSRPLDWLTLNLAAFRYNYSNQQIAAYQNVNGVPLAVLQNAARSRITGGEVNFDALLADAFSLHGGVSVLHAVFSKFPGAVDNVPAPNNAGTIQQPVDATGRHLPFSPNFTASLTAIYTKALQMGKITLSADIYYTDKFYFDVANRYKQPSYATLGLRASFQPESLQGLTIDLWGKNLTNKTIIQGAFINTNTVGYAYEPPVTYGATLKFEF